MAKTDLTAQRVRELLDYDQETGVFVHRLLRKGRELGSPWGRIAHDGYMFGHVGGKPHRLHRLAWLHVTGEWPRGQIDHRNGNRSDNRFANLRDVPHEINVQNRHAPRAGSRAGLLGVTFDPKRRKPWRASIAASGKQHRLGSFETPELAHEAYLRAKPRFHAAALPTA